MKKDPHIVCEMFNAISPTYDRVNRLVSFGIDRAWRASLAREMQNKADLHLVDLATGTADQLIALLKLCPHISHALGIDIAEEMLERGRKKLLHKQLESRARLVCASALALPIEDETVDCTTISFGIRNMENPLTCLKEMHRILRINGQALILEFSLPKNRFIRAAYLLYLRYLLPCIGGLVSGTKQPYAYLNQTIEKFPCGEAFCELMMQANFANVEAIPLTFGVVTLYKGTKL